VGNQELPGNKAREEAVKTVPANGVKRRAALGALSAVGTLCTVGAAVSALPVSAWAQPSGGSQPAAPVGPPALERIRKAGRLTVGVYEQMAPFHDKGVGIDVDIAKALAEAVGVPLSLIPFHAGENMDDDLRAMVWRGHYLGFGPADVLLHVPVDAPLMNANRQVSIFAPYYRERLVLARDIKAVPKLESMADFKGHRIAVPGQSLAGWLLIGSDNGAYRDQLDTKLADSAAAAKMLMDGKVQGAAGHASEIESSLHGDARFAIEPLPLPRMRDGWPIGCAVKRDAADLAQLLKAAVEKMNAEGSMKALFAKHKVIWRAP
jgi:ABC-type amino acid transport substrate-binding protein